jgi:hypothetical protein
VVSLICAWSKAAWHAAAAASRNAAEFYRLGLLIFLQGWAGSAAGPSQAMTYVMDY